MSSDNNEKKDERSSVKDNATLGLHRAILAAQHLQDEAGSNE